MVKKQSEPIAANEYKKIEKVIQDEKGLFYFTDLVDEGIAERLPAKRLLLQQSQLTRPSQQLKDPLGDPNNQVTEVKSGSGLPKVIIDGEIFYRVEGDLLLDIDDLELYRQQQMAHQEQRKAAKLAQVGRFGQTAISNFTGETSQLVGMVEEGKLVRWAPNITLTYCILKNTFPRNDWYEEVVENMQLATTAWEETCGVDFEYRHELDNSLSVRPEGVLFPVRYIAAGGAFIAAAFFPTDPPNRRRVLVDPSYFTTKFDHVGVFRHELGHTLGFRHEHIRSDAPPLCPDEDVTGTINLTNYDPRSVMHYFCGDVGSRTLAITDVDRVGAQLVYGPPLAHFQLVSP